MPETEITPCDRILIPVYLTYLLPEGLRVCKAMFAESNTIVLRWYEDDCTMRQKVAFKPQKWVNGRNYFNPEERKWRYG